MGQSNSPVYLQFQKKADYPVFIRLEAGFLEGRIHKLITDMGFNTLSEQEMKKVAVKKLSTKVLSISRASARVAQQVRTPDALDQFGAESLTYRGDYHVYLYRHVGMMVFSPATSLWELGIACEFSSTDELASMRVILTRYLSWALANVGVLAYWGVATQDGIVVMRQQQSFGEAVFVDVERRTVWHTGGELSLDGKFTVYRADRQTNNSKSMSAEELISFLSTSTTHLSHFGLPHILKRAAMRFGAMASGVWSHLPQSHREGPLP